jgi:hypothetical protein
MGMGYATIGLCMPNNQKKEGGNTKKKQQMLQPGRIV